MPMLLKRATGRGERKVENCEQMRELEMTSLIGRGFKLGFVPIFHFPLPRSPCSIMVTSLGKIFQVDWGKDVRVL